MSLHILLVIWMCLPSRVWQQTKPKEHICFQITVHLHQQAPVAEAHGCIWWSQVCKRDRTTGFFGSCWKSYKSHWNSAFWQLPFLYIFSGGKNISITSNGNINWGKSNTMKRKYLCQKHLVSSDRMKHLPTLSSESLLASALPGETLNVFEKKKIQTKQKQQQQKNPVTTNSIFQKVWKIYIWN